MLSTTASHAGAGHLVGMGGGGFSMEPDNPLLDDFVLSLSRRQPARVCFVPTASGDSTTYLVHFYRAFSGRAIPTDLTLFDSPLLPRHPDRRSELAAFVAAQDILYVGGGNTANLLALWRTHGLDVVFRDAWLKGTVLSGLSAGMLCWFNGGLTDSFGGLERLTGGLGLIDASACPHYQNEERRRGFHRVIAQDGGFGYGVDDSAALHFVGTTLVEAVSSRPDARAYHVTCADGRVVETPLPTRFLGAAEAVRMGSGE